MFDLATLVYADDLVLMSCDRAKTEKMLQVVDFVCSRLGLSVNAADTELMAVWHDGAEPLEAVQLSGGEAQCALSSIILVLLLNLLPLGRLRSAPASAKLTTGFWKCDMFGSCAS
jgi:hypothetical protein